MTQSKTDMNFKLNSFLGIGDLGQAFSGNIFDDEFVLELPCKSVSARSFILGYSGS